MHGLPQLRRPSISPSVLVITLIIVAVAGALLVTRFARSEEERELVHWQNKLNLIADSRAAALDDWVEMHFRELRAVADNPSLQIYLADILSKSREKNLGGEEPAQAVFLRNLLVVTADRLHFLTKPSSELQSVHANVSQPSGTGLALIGMDGKVLVSTGGLNAPDADLSKKLAEVSKTRPSFIDAFSTASGPLRVGFVLPVYAIQQDASTAQPIANLVGVKNLDDSFFMLLRHPGVTEKTLEALLVRKEGDSVAFLSPPQSAGPLADKFSLTTVDLDAAYAINSPDSFAIKKDRQSHVTLMTSRLIVRTPWTLLLHIDRNQALAESDSWRRQMQYVMISALLAMIGGIIAVWYYGTSKRALLLSEETARMAALSAAQERLLRVVTDNQHESIFIADARNTVWFVNEKAAKSFKIKAADSAGKELVALMGPVWAKDYSEANAQALKANAMITRSRRKQTTTSAEVIHSEHIPLSHIPIDTLPFPTPGVLVVDQDVTEVVNERERRMRVLHQLVDTLVCMVDKRDPYAANHSAMVAMLAREVASGMGLSPEMMETAEISGKLMNIGKIVIPSALLTKMSALMKNEMEMIRNSLHQSIELLKNIDFDAPVTETLRQAQECVDGSGPLRMKGDEIIITARIIAAVNAFVGMINTRSYRKALTIEQAIQQLLQDMDSQFDRRVVLALADFIENKQGREQLIKLSNPAIPT
jgi:HD-GYP domain-containing protein (c-di-GMP phosphodiesterase class II)